MFWILDREEDFDRISTYKKCYINVIPLNSYYHPTFSTPSLIYIKLDNHKGYLLPINHNDAFSLDLEVVKKFILRHEKIYVINKKETIHYLGDGFRGENIIDINLLHLQENVESLDISSIKTTVTKFLEKAFKEQPRLSSSIPITKHYEEQTKLFKIINPLLDKEPINQYYNTDYINVLQRIEENGMSINLKELNNHFKLEYPEFSIENYRIFTQYNLYNFTSRPSNAFNGINFAALNKSDETRKSFNSAGKLFEFDYDGYHLRLIGKLIWYEFSDESVHITLGKMYFNKEELTKEEYKESKQISFRQMYGNVYKEYEHIEFFKKTKQYIRDLFKKTKELGYLELKGGRKIQLDQIENPTPSKLFNYLIQSMETYYNVVSIKKVLDYLESFKSKCILYTYDSILIDFDFEDKPDILKEVKRLMEEEGMKINVSYGNTYNDLKKV